MFEQPKPAAKDIHALHATMCQTIADSIRIAVLYKPSDNAEHSVNELVATLKLPQATVSWHLRTLRNCVLDALALIRSVQADIYRTGTTLFKPHCHKGMNKFI